VRLRAELLSSFRHPGFGLLWGSVCLNGFASHVSTVSITWLGLVFTDSPLGVGLALAVRVLPRLVLAVPIGSLSDRSDRRALLQLTNVLGSLSAAVVVFASWFGWLGFTELILIAAGIGTLEVAETTLVKAYVYDVVGGDDAVNGMMLEQMANKIFGVVAGISSGILLAAYSGTGAFVAIALAYGASALLLWFIPRVAPDAGRRTSDPVSASDTEPPLRVWSSIKSLMQTRAVLVFAIIATAAEVFAYSHEVLAPSFARDILQVGEVGLGNLVAARNAGGVVGLLLLGSISSRVRPERLLPIVCVSFGLGLVLFSTSESYVVSIGLIAFVGVAWASLDALLPTVMQQNVADSDRGAAVGVWNLSRGFGPLGELEIGALAMVLGVAVTQAINGATFAIVVLVVLWWQRRQSTASA
jgi:MFS family permease